MFQAFWFCHRQISRFRAHNVHLWKLHPVLASEDISHHICIHLSSPLVTMLLLTLLPASLSLPLVSAGSALPFTTDPYCSQVSGNTTSFWDAAAALCEKQWDHTSTGGPFTWFGESQRRKFAANTTRGGLTATVQLTSGWGDDEHVEWDRERCYADFSAVIDKCGAFSQGFYYPDGHYSYTFEVL